MAYEPFERRATRRSMALGMFWTFVMAAVGLWMVTNRYAGGKATLVGYFLILAGGVSFLVFAAWTVRPPSGLRFGPGGIASKSPFGGSFQDLAWDQMASARLAPYRGKTVVVLDLVDPEYGMDSLKEHPLKIRQGQRDELGSWTYLQPSAYGMTPEQLLAEIQRSFAAFGPGSPPSYPRAV